MPNDDQPAAYENVVQRLQRRIREARRLGYRVRSEWLDDQQPGWCQIGGITTIFLDQTQPAAEQLAQLEESLRSLVNAELAVRSVRPAA